MHVGYTGGFQNPGNQLDDSEVWDHELRLADLAVDLGFDSLWVVEHHFSDYFLSPDPVQLLTWMGGRHPDVRLGTGVIVLPWHDPLRCAEQIVMLDNVTGGRLILGIGRGLGKTEYDGYRVDMETSRERFLAYAHMIIEALETGFMEADNEFITQPRVELRPRPKYSLKGRTYAAAMTPEAMPLMATLGTSLLIVPQKPWESVRDDLAGYHRAWAEANGPDVPPPAPLCAGNIVVDADARRVEELAYQYIGGYYHTVIDHYGFDKKVHEGVRGYEFYANIGKYIDKRGADGAVADYVNLMPWGTPDQVLQKLATLRDLLGIAAFNPSFNFAGMPPETAEKSIRLFAQEVLPVLHGWNTPELAPVKLRAAPATV